MHSTYTKHAHTDGSPGPPILLSGGGGVVHARLAIGNYHYGGGKSRYTHMVGWSIVSLQ